MSESVDTCARCKREFPREELCALAGWLIWPFCIFALTSMRGDEQRAYLAQCYCRACRRRLAWCCIFINLMLLLLVCFFLGEVFGLL